MMGTRISGLSLRTLFTLVLTGRLSKGPQKGSRTSSSSAGWGVMGASHMRNHRGSMMAGCRWWMS